MDHVLATESNAYILAAETWTDNVAQCVKTALKSVDIDKVKRLAEDILTYQNVVCIGYGMSGILGTLLSSRLKFQGKGINATHCMTRLRLQLKDYKVADKDAIKALKGVSAALEQGG